MANLSTGFAAGFGKYASENAVRTCVCCRERFKQGELFRLCADGMDVKPFEGKGRSFYLCPSCIEGERAVRSLCRMKNAPKDKNLIKERIQEIRIQWQKSE